MQAQYQKSDKNNLKPRSWSVIPKVVTAFVLVFSIFKIRHIVKTQSNRNFVVRESLVLIHTLLFVLTIAFQLIFMAVDNGVGKRYDVSDPVVNFRHQYVFYFFELASQFANLPMMLLFFYVAFR